jgi:nucleoside-triphosphatase THEP1
MPKNIIIITGKINSGKTTLAKKIADDYLMHGKKIGGIISDSRRNIQTGEKIIYILRDLKSGKHCLLASLSQTKEDDFKVGKYYFSPEAFKFASKAFRNAKGSNAIFIDELGPLELEKKGFYDAVVSLLKNYSGTLILVIRENILDEMIKELRIKNYELKIANQNNREKND